MIVDSKTADTKSEPLQQQLVVTEVEWRQTEWFRTRDIANPVQETSPWQDNFTGMILDLMCSFFKIIPTEH